MDVTDQLFVFSSSAERNQTVAACGKMGGKPVADRLLYERNMSV